MVFTSHLVITGLAGTGFTGIGIGGIADEGAAHFTGRQGSDIPTHQVNATKGTRYIHRAGDRRKINRPSRNAPLYSRPFVARISGRWSAQHHLKNIFGGVA